MPNYFAALLARKPIGPIPDLKIDFRVQTYVQQLLEDGYHASHHALIAFMRDAEATSCLCRPIPARDGYFVFVAGHLIFFKATRKLLWFGALTHFVGNIRPLDGDWVVPARRLSLFE